MNTEGYTYRPRIPTALTEAESIALEDLARGKRVLEAGALLGYSTVVMAQVAEHVVSVDPHAGYPPGDPRPTFDQFYDNLDHYGVLEKVTPVVGKLETVLPTLTADYFDLVFLDLTGEYEDTLRALTSVEAWLQGGGIIVVHDCDHPDWPGVRNAVDEFATTIEIEPRLVDRLAIFVPLWDQRFLRH